MDIPFTKPKGSISTNRKRGAHLYSDSVPLANLPQQTQEDQDFCMLKLVVNTRELEVNDEAGHDNVETDHLCVEQESSQCVSLASKKSSTSFMFLHCYRFLLQMKKSWNYSELNSTTVLITANL